MTPTVWAAAPLIIAGVLFASCLAKLRHPESAEEWADLGVPTALRRPWLVKLHPWGELLLALALALLGGVLGALAAVVAVLLFGAYLLLVQRRRAQAPDASCACFGARRPITGITIVRNVWFLALSVLSAGVIWMTPPLGGAFAVLAGDWGWAVALAAAALTTGLILWQPAEPAESAIDAGIPAVGSKARAGDRDAEEYVRTRTPAVPVTLADGRTVNLRDLAARGPMLLLAVKEDCGACTKVIEAVPRWRELLPEVAVRFLLWPAPGNSALTEIEEPQSLHDPYMYVQGSIADWSTPAAVLIGADGYLAGGPVSGYDEVSAFIGDIYEVLHGERPHSGE